MNILVEKFGILPLSGKKLKQQLKLYNKNREKYYNLRSKSKKKTDCKLNYNLLKKHTTVFYLLTINLNLCVPLF